MATIQDICYISYDGLYDYVANRNKKAFREEFERRKTYTKKFALEFFPKYIDFEKWSKTPKNPRDILLINYWLIEVPDIGLKNTKLFQSYSYGNSILTRRLKKKSVLPMKIRSKKS